MFLYARESNVHLNMVSPESPRGVGANVLDWDIVLSEFEIQQRHYVHFRTNTLGKGMNSLIPSTIG